MQHLNADSLTRIVTHFFPNVMDENGGPTKLIKNGGSFFLVVGPRRIGVPTSLFSAATVYLQSGQVYMGIKKERSKTDCHDIYDGPVLSSHRDIPHIECALCNAF